MTQKHGTDLGGIRTVADLRDRCWVDDLTGCWHWRMACCGGVPKVHLVLPDGTKHLQRGRRAAVMLDTGAALPRGKMAWEAPKCKTALCVNPAHCRVGTKAQWGAWLRESGRLKNLPTKIRAAHQARQARILVTEAMAAEILARPGDSLERLAADLGVSRFAVWRVRRRGGAPVVAAANASVFTWRGVA